MAIAKGNKSTEGNSIKRYIGVAPVFVLAVNPNKQELEKLYDTQLENDPEYLSEIELDGKKVPNVRIDFIVKTDSKVCNIEFTTKIPFFIRKEYRYNRDKTKVQVIDKYGRTAWVTVEQAKNKEIPICSNGQPANIDKDYRPCFIGEEEITNFIRTYLNIPSVMKYVNNTWIMVDHPEDCEVRLDNILEYFKGNFKELKEILTFQPNNKVKALFGVKTTDDNKQYQSVYTQMFLRNNVSDYSKLDKNLQERLAAGAYPTTEFSVENLREYTVESTNLNTAQNAADPFFSEEGDDPFGL